MTNLNFDEILPLQLSNEYDDGFQHTPAFYSTHSLLNKHGNNTVNIVTNTGSNTTKSIGSIGADSSMLQRHSQIRKSSKGKYSVSDASKEE